jgi:hypothetical protein
MTLTFEPQFGWRASQRLWDGRRVESHAQDLYTVMRMAAEAAERDLQNRAAFEAARANTSQTGETNGEYTRHS